MVQDVTKDYVKEEEHTSENTNNEEHNKDVVFDIEEDKELLEEELKSNGLYFNLEEGVTYKVRLTTTKVQKVEKTFERDGEEPDVVTKYVLGIAAKGSDKSEFEGLWEVGKGILNPIFKDYEKGAVFNVSKTGKGLKTRYSVSKDF